MNEKEIDHLLTLARLEIGGKEKEGLIDDLSLVLKYVDQLLEVDVKDIDGQTGGTDNFNVIRNDCFENRGFSNVDVKNSFPNIDGDFLKVPKVFE